MSEAQDLLNMTASTIGRDILQALVQEITLLPNVWPKMSEAKQNDVLDRLRSRVDHNVKMAVHLIASDGRTVVTGDLDQITIKDGVKAVVKFSSAAPNLHELNPDDADPVPTKVLGDAPNEHGVYTCAPDEVLSWELKKDWCDIELLELENGRWLHAIATHFGSGQSSEPMTCKDQTAASRLEAIRAAQSRLVQIYSKGENCGLKGKAFENFRAWVDSLLGEERTVAA
jgi:hypothetical protein